MEFNFEWDENKRLSNLEKHGIDFKDAIQIFFDPNRLESVSKRQDYDEIRWQIIGKIGENYLVPRLSLGTIIRGSASIAREKLNSVRFEVFPMS
jgi:uncharacterized DUF497 family protein